MCTAKSTGAGVINMGSNQNGDAIRRLQSILVNDISDARRQHVTLLPVLVFAALDDATRNRSSLDARPEAQSLNEIWIRIAVNGEDGQTTSSEDAR